MAWKWRAKTNEIFAIQFAPCSFYKFRLLAKPFLEFQNDFLSRSIPTNNERISPLGRASDEDALLFGSLLEYFRH
jgi:hypothetical protein